MEINTIQKCVNLHLEIKNNTVRIEVSDEGQGINLDFTSYDQKNLNAVEEGL